MNTSNPGSSLFPRTQWSVVLGAGREEEAARHAALEALCRHYWYPLYVYLRRTGHAHSDAEDLTQDFLAHLLAREGLAFARPDRGRFRTFLLSSLRNHIVNDWHRRRAQKRGEGRQHLPLEFSSAADRYAVEPRSPELTPEKLYDRHWAQAMIEQALAELRIEYEQSGRGPLFSELEPLLWHDTTAGSHAACANRLSMRTHAFTVALDRLRHRVGERLRDIVAQTVEDPSEVNTELVHLLAIMG
jgi:RNA polymerase sigma-70 factor (ECF subfamily)